MQMSIRRLLRSLDTSPVLLVGLLTAICLPAILVLAWTVSSRWEHSYIDSTLEKQRSYIERTQQEAQQDFDSSFGQVRMLLQWLSDEGAVSAAVTKAYATRPRSSPAPRNTNPKNESSRISDNATSNEFLRRVAAGFGVDLVFVLNAEGLCIASSDAGSPSSAFGHQLGDRRYFKEAMAHKLGRQFAMGRVTKVPGFYFSAPIVRNGRVLGVVAVKINQVSLARRVRIQNAIVTDDMGLVVLSDESRYLMKVLPHGAALTAQPEDLEKRYNQKSFATLDLQPYEYGTHAGLYLLDGLPVLIQSRNRNDDALTVHLYAPLYVLHNVVEQRRMIFVGSTLAALLIVAACFASLVFYLRSRSYRVNIEEANVQLAKLNQELQEQASHDFLTGSLNRRAFSVLLSNEFVRAKRYGTPLSLAIIDIDYFKRINDRYGHLVGDAVLRHLVATLIKIMRKSDSLSRLGGEEFALLMPNTGIEEAVTVVDRMRQFMETDVVPETEPPVSFTFSAGVAEFEKEMVQSTLLAKADAALYEAKGAGRNRVMMAT